MTKADRDDAIRAEVRARIIAWMRREAASVDADDPIPCPITMKWAADAIENEDDKE